MRCLSVAIISSFVAFAVATGRAAADEKALEDGPPGLAGGKEIQLTVADAVRSAFANHPEIAKAKIDVEIARAEILRQRGIFDPILSLAAMFRREGEYIPFPEITLTGVNKHTRMRADGSVSGRTSLGTRYNVSAGVGRFRDGGIAGIFIRMLPIYDNILSARVTQPLLRDGGLDANRGLVERAKLEAEFTAAEQNELLQQLILEVVAGYWELVVRHEKIRISEASLSDARKLRELVTRQIRGGRAPRSDLAQADVTVAERQQAVDQGRLAVVEAERALLELTFLNRGSLGWRDQIIPAEEPGGEPAKPDFSRELAIALENRPEVRRVERAVELARLNQSIANNQRKIRFDLHGEAGILGFAGRNVVEPGSPVGAPHPLILGGFRRSVLNAVGLEAPFFEVGVTLEVPIGNRERTGAFHKAELQVNRAQAEDVRSQVTYDVRAALQRVVIVARRLETARRTAKLAEENVEAQQARYRGGAGILFDVLRAQDELARAQAAVVLAAAEQEVALTQLEAARGTLLDRFGIDLQDSRGGSD